MFLCGALPVTAFSAPWSESGEVPGRRSPNHVSVSREGSRAYVVNRTAGSISVLDLPAGRVVAEIFVGSAPVHGVLSPDGKVLYVSRLHAGDVAVVDLKRRGVARTIPAGIEPYGLALSEDGRSLYVVNSISGTLSVVDAASGETRASIPVGREPRFVAPLPDGNRVLVTNGLSRDISVVDVRAGRAVEARPLGRANILRQAAVSADGALAFVAHVISRDERTALQMERGWIHSNGFSVLDLNRPGRYATLLLDRLLDGAANPWGAVLSRDGRKLYLTLSGVHEVAVVDLEKASKLADETPPEAIDRLAQNVEIVETRGIARRVPAGGRGPRGLAVNPATGDLVVANYFSDTVSLLDGETGKLRSVVSLGEPPAETLVRRGERLFNDADLCFQRWFSCASCHQEDATMDGLNWDLPNDGIGNFKNVKSLHDAYDTAPAMWTGVRADLDAAVQAGQRFLGFLPRKENHEALIAYLSDPPRAPNLFRRRIDERAVARGREVFTRALCRSCHAGPALTDRRKYDLGLSGIRDQHARFDTPSLRDVYRTGPYLHDGRAETLRSIFTHHDPHGLHGRTKGLTETELEDLLAYLRTL